MRQSRGLKKTFSLRTGARLSGEDDAVRTFPVRVEDGAVYVSIQEEG